MSVYEDPANDPVECDLRHQGQIYDKETGLYYNRHRYYDTDIGQYLSSDPIGMAGGLRPQGYVFNPVDWVDPLGLSPSGCPKGDETLLPDSYWIDKRSPKQVTPGTRTINEMKPSSGGGQYHKTTHYDEFGRQIGQTHRTSHGYSNPNGKHYHPNPHHHRRDPITGEKLKDPNTGSRTWPGLFGN